MGYRHLGRRAHPVPSFTTALIWLNPSRGEEREMEEPYASYAYRFFAQPFAQQESIQKYKVELSRRLDAMTAERAQLKEFVS